MFDSLLSCRRPPERRFGWGLAAAALIHGGALAAWASWRDAAAESPYVTLTFVKPPPAPAPLARHEEPAAVRPKVRSREAKRPARDVLLAPREVQREERAAQPEPPAATESLAKDEPAIPNGDAGGTPGGTAGGVTGGVAGPVAAVNPDPAPRVDFDDAMTPPRLVAGPQIEYTREALDGEVEGLMIVRCVVTVDGVVHGCRVVKGLPFMDGPVVAALERRRYAPATLHGRPLDVNYTFRIKLMMPR